MARAATSIPEDAFPTDGAPPVDADGAAAGVALSLAREGGGAGGSGDGEDEGFGESYALNPSKSCANPSAIITSVGMYFS